MARKNVIGLAGRLRLWDDKGAKIVDSCNTIVNEGLNVCARLIGKAATFESTGVPFSYKMYSGSTSISKEDTTPAGTLVAEGEVVSYEVDTGEHSVALGMNGTNTGEATTKAALFYGDYLFSEILANISPGVTYTGSWTVYFAPASVVITASVSPSAGGTVTGAGSYTKGDTVTLTATPSSSKYVFAYWNTGDTDATITFTADESTSYTAYFTINTFTVTTVCDPEEGGTITGGGTYTYGDTATLTVTENSEQGYAFNRWADGSYLNPRSVTVIEDVTYTAQFDENSWSVTLFSVAEDASTVNATLTGAGRYTLGTSVTVTASKTATNDYGTNFTFLRWSSAMKGGTTLSTSTSYTFTVSGYTSLYAIYESDSSED